MPRGLVYSGASALLSIIGGPTFVRKVGLGEPSAVMTHALLLLGRLRAAVLSCLPMRTEYPPLPDPFFCFFAPALLRE